jgi:uncharacterized DUF497 family protein
MKFEFDPAKSRANKEKHSIDFVAAQELWNDPDAIAGEAKFVKERRWMLIAGLKEKIWSAIYTMRGDNVRIISVRPARDIEKEAYENTQDEDKSDGSES